LKPTCISCLFHAVILRSLQLSAKFKTGAVHPRICQISVLELTGLWLLFFHRWTTWTWSGLYHAWKCISMLNLSFRIRSLGFLVGTD
jgi:hypothetical protein